ncbi:hypothetical protein J7M02_07140 [Candidatus Aerophobetes bacterium]|nr:hypothetical protein [Candidatus Aerophobetes bacterium]
MKELEAFKYHECTGITHDHSLRFMIELFPEPPSIFLEFVSEEEKEIVLSGTFLSVTVTALKIALFIPSDLRILQENRQYDPVKIYTLRPIKSFTMLKGAEHFLDYVYDSMDVTKPMWLYYGKYPLSCGDRNCFIQKKTYKLTVMKN